MGSSPSRMGPDVASVGLRLHLLAAEQVCTMNLLCSTAHMMKILLRRNHVVKCTHDEVITAQST